MAISKLSSRAVGRPRLATDEQILDAVARVVGRLGPARFTLSQVADEVGLAASTLIKRFGTKRKLLLALASRADAHTDACFADARARFDDPLDGVVHAATAMARGIDSREVLANHLAFLQIDLTDTDFHALALAQAKRAQAGYESLLGEAIARGMLVSVDVDRLAHAIQAIAGGALIAWAIHGEGSAVDAVVRDVSVLIDPYRKSHMGS
jgi:AcrR family transcriptional regulator